jgi:predicted nucleic acid-binding protein
MLLLISDANILIDMEAGKLLEKLFQLPFNFAIPDILYWEEIEPETQGLEVLGLKVLEVRGEFVDYAFAMQSKYGKAPSTNDYLGLALAKQEGCPLLTGDQALKLAAQAEDVKVMGTVWLLSMLVKNQLLSVEGGLDTLTLMRESKRRLPWADAERILNGLRSEH